MSPSDFIRNNTKGMSLPELAMDHNRLMDPKRGTLAVGTGAPSSAQAAFLDQVDCVSVTYMRSDCDATDSAFIRRDGDTFLGYLRTTSMIEVLGAADMRGAVAKLLGEHAHRDSKVHYLYHTVKPAESSGKVAV